MPDRITMKIEVPPDFKERVEKESSLRGISKSQLVMMAVEYLLNTQEMQSSE